MSDPVLDEHEIVEDLHLPVTKETIARLQMACIGAMCDLYDRKVTRENYVALLGPCISMYGALAKLYIANSVRTSFHKGDVNADTLNQLVRGLEDNARSHVGNVRQVMAALTACPTSQDPVH